MNRTTAIALLFITVVGSAVLFGVLFTSNQSGSIPAGSSTDVTEIEIDPLTNVTQNESGFYMEAEIVHRWYGHGDSRSFDHVMLCLYDRDGTLLQNHDVGSFENPVDLTRMTVQANTTPHYILVDHPELRSLEGFSLERLTWNNETGRYVEATPDQLEFGYPISDEIGTCP